MNIVALKNNDELKFNWKDKIIIVSKDELDRVFDEKTDKDIIETFKFITSNKIDSYGENYLATFNFIFSETASTASKVEKIGLYSDFKTFSIYVTNNKEQIYSMLKSVESKANDHAGMLINLIASLTENDSVKLESFENELSAFDDKLLNEKNLENASRKISTYRRVLVRYKHHYEQLNLIIDFFALNKELLSSKEELECYSLLSRRIPRLYKEIMQLRDMVSEIRENYQSQIGIRQNNLMKMFTIITAIFMPLQLIVGWYGMNLIMPEFAWKWSYAVVIVVSVVLVASLLIWFKKKKWFK